MTQATASQVYRISVAAQTCRSAIALLGLTVREVPHVSAVMLTTDNTLVVLAEDGYDLYDRLVAAVIESGFDPMLVTVAELERLIDPDALSYDQALSLGLITPPKEPVRASVVQRVSIQVTDGYDPDSIIVAAGVPVEVVFSEGHGCLGRVVFDSLGVEADLEHGGAVISLPALEAGTYPFRCGRDLVHGTLIAE